MLKILFLQSDATEYIGIMSISALLKQNGIYPDILIARDVSKIMDYIDEYRPQIVAFSCMTPQAPWAIETASAVKARFKCLIVAGGPHPTFMPEMIEHPAIDIICRGEGESAMLDLATAVSQEKTYTSIPNLWVKYHDKIYRNDIGELIKDLDTLPLPDRQIYYAKYKFMSNNPLKIFITSRGCPFYCAFCYNNVLVKLYAGKGRYIRRKSPLKVIEEVKDVQNKYKLKTVIFTDDIFSLDKIWLNELLAHYKKEIDLPFNCNIRADIIDEETIRMLKGANCYSVNFGIESGVEKVRTVLLKKNVTNGQIINTARLLKKYKISFLANNIMGLPSETVEEAIETVKLNSMIRTDMPWCSILQPFPGTDIAKYAIDNGYVDEESLRNQETFFFRSSIIKQKNINELCNLQKFFILAVRFPWALPVIKKLIRLPPNKFFDLLFLVTYFSTYKKRHNVGFLRAIVFGLSFRHHFKS